MVDFTSNTLDVFIIGDIDTEKVEGLKKGNFIKSEKKLKFTFDISIV